MQKFYVLSSLNAGLFFRKHVKLKSLFYFWIEENICQIIDIFINNELIVLTISNWADISICFHKKVWINLSKISNPWKDLNEIISPWNFLPSRVIFYRTPWRHKRLVYAYLAKSSADWNSGNWVSSLFRTITWHFS